MYKYNVQCTSTMYNVQVQCTMYNVQVQCTNISIVQYKYISITCTIYYTCTTSSIFLCRVVWTMKACHILCSISVYPGVWHVSMFLVLVTGRGTRDKYLGWWVVIVLNAASSLVMSWCLSSSSHKKQIKQILWPRFALICPTGALKFSKRRFPK